MDNNWQQWTTIRVATCISDTVLSQTNVGVESNSYCLCNTQYSHLKMPQLNRSMTHVGELGAEQRPTRMSWTRSSRQSWWRPETMVIILILLKQFEQQIWRFRRGACWRCWWSILWVLQSLENEQSQPQHLATGVLTHHIVNDVYGRGYLLT